MKSKHFEQVGNLILRDGDGLCEVTSDLMVGDDKSLVFEITNPDTQRKYEVSVRISEIVEAQSA